MTLYDYQVPVKDKIVKKLSKHGLVYVTAQERTGKTITTLTALKELPSVNRVLIVSLKAALGDIERDANACGCPYRITYINYESLHKVLTQTDFDVIIFDEASRLSAFPKANKTITLARDTIYAQKRPPYVVYLNATPSAESYNQFFYPFFITGKVWQEYNGAYDWFREYGIPDSIRIAGGQRIESYKKVKSKKVLEDIKKYLVSLTREDAGFDQSEAQVKTIKLTPPDEVLKPYNKLKKDKMLDDPEVIADSAAKLATKLQQITGGFVYGETDTYVFSTHKASSLRKWLKKKGYKKPAIYAKFTREIDMIKDALRHDYAIVDYDEFKQADSGVCFVSQVKSGAKGIDLSSADIHVFYSLDWSGETFIQGIARQHNKKRTNKVKVRVLSYGLIDQEIFEAVSNKRDFTSTLYRRIA